MSEIWKPIKNYEGYYEISSLGRVKALTRTIKQKDHYICWKERIKTLRTDYNGYQVVTLCKDRCSKTFYIHRLLAEAFIPNPENKLYVDHINTITYDNRLENLRWVTAEENSNNNLTLQHFKNDASNRESINKRLISRKLHKTKTGPKTVYQYDINGKFIAEHFSTADAGRAVNCSPSYIRDILDTSKTFNGFFFTSVIKQGV